jgi:hypothetical protein
VPPSFTDVTSTTHTVLQTIEVQHKLYFINYLDKLPSRDLAGGMKYIKFWLLVISNMESHYPILMLWIYKVETELKRLNTKHVNQEPCI